MANAVLPVLSAVATDVRTEVGPFHAAVHAK
jgi:hypothetical protein